MTGYKEETLQQSADKAVEYLNEKPKGFHSSTFEYLKPTEEQLTIMSIARMSIAECSTQLEKIIPNGPDKTYLLRKLREVGMWANVAITRMPDGSPRT